MEKKLQKKIIEYMIKAFKEVNIEADGSVFKVYEDAINFDFTEELDDGSVRIYSHSFESFEKDGLMFVEYFIVPGIENIYQQRHESTFALLEANGHNVTGVWGVNDDGMAFWKARIALNNGDVSFDQINDLFGGCFEETVQMMPVLFPSKI
jgi:hypothetical protein